MAKRKMWKKLAAGVLSASLMLSAVSPVWAESTESAAALQPEDAAADLSQIAEEAGRRDLLKTGAYKGSFKLEFGQAMLDAMSASSDTGEDFSWLKSAGGDGVLSVDENGGIQFSGESLLNDSHLMDALGTFDDQTGILYLQMPELSDKPIALNLQDMFSSAQDSDITDPDDIAGALQDGLSARLGITADDQARLAQEAQDLAASIDSQEVTDFLGRYAGTIASNMSVTQESGATASAGSLSEDVTNTKISIDSDQMDAILTACASSLKDDEFILKLLGSDFCVDLINLMGEAYASSQSGQNGVDGQTSGDASAAWTEMSADDIISVYQQLTGSLTAVSGMPGFTLTLGIGADGALKNLSFHILYQGMDISIFTMTMLKQGDRNAFEFKLGEMIAQAFASSDESGNASGDGTGTTGLSAEGTNAGGLLNETVTLLCNDQTLCEIDLVDWNTADMGSVSLRAISS